MENQRAKFSIPKEVTYLNCAYMSPVLKSVEAAGIKGIRRKRNPFSISSDDFFRDAENVRVEFAKLVNASRPNMIAIIPSASYGLSTVAKNVHLDTGDKVIVASEQFPSNYYPWQRLTHESRSNLLVVHPPDTLLSRGKIWNERILDAIDSKTKLVCLGHVHWADGTRFDLAAIRKRTREVGALLIIDGTQSVGAMPFDIQKIQPDALVCAAYKWLLGPYSMGMAYYGEYFDNGIPIEENWINRQNSEDFTGLVNYQNNYQPGSIRYDVGEHSNFILIPMMLEALKQISRWKPENIQDYCRKISHQAIEKITAAGYWLEDEAYRGNHIFGVRFPKSLSLDLMKERIRKKKIAISFRGNSMRVAPNVYNDANDFKRLVGALTGK